MKIIQTIKNNTKLAIMLAIIILLGSVGVTFALVIGNFKNINVNTTTAIIDASISYDTNSNSSEIISNGNMMPIADSLVTGPDVTDPRVIKATFNVTGNSENPTDTIYDIALHDIGIDCDLRTKDLKWRLYKGDELISDPNASLSPTFDTMANDRLVLTETQENLTTVTDKYTFLLWISETCTDGNIANCNKEQDQSIYLNKNINATIKIELSTKTKKPIVRTVGSEGSCEYIETPIPICNELTYNGSEQELVSATGNYTLINSLGNNAGEYKVTAVLDDNYKWSNGETEDKILTCNINKKDVTITTLNQSIKYGNSISSTTNDVTISGLLDNEHINTVTLSSNIVDVGEGIISTNNLEIINSFGKNTTSNYNISRNNTGKITILCRNEAEPPIVNNLVYNGTEQTGVHSGKYVDVSGTTTAEEIGTYKAGATPIKNYCWSDNTNSKQNYTWKITDRDYTINLIDYVKSEPGVLYIRTDVGVYTDENYTNNMTSITNPVEVPTRTGYLFKGYYTEENGEGTQIIGENGYLTAGFELDILSNIKTGALYALWEENFTTVEIPTAANYCKTLTYNGANQTLTNSAAQGYKFSNNKRTLAGTQTVTATLEEGYIWSDNTKGNKTFECSIGQATMTGGSVSISGTLTYLSKLTANVVAPTTPTSGVTYTYAWYANDTNSTEGGTKVGSNKTLTLYASSFKKYVYVVVTMTDSNGNYKTKTVSAITTSIIAPRPITVVSGSSSKVYDGTPLTNSSCSLKSGSTISSTDHSLSCTTSGTITNYGSTPNTISEAKIVYTSTGNDVSGFYSITTEPGTLTITKQKMTGGSVSISGNLEYYNVLTAKVTAPTKPSSGVTYSYQWYYNDEKSTIGGTKISGATSSTYRTLRVTYDKYVYCVVTMTDSNGNYESKTVSGITSGTITKRPITITSGSSTKAYDGTPLTNNTCSLKSGSTIASGHTLNCTTSGTITNVGSTNNTISTLKIMYDGLDVTSYYSITKEPGTLTVTKATMTGGSVSISGTLTYGSKLTATVTAPTKPSSGVTYSYQWYTNTTQSTEGGTKISGATSSTYTLFSTTLDKYVYCVVTMKDSNGNYSNKTVSQVTSGTIGKRPITVVAGSSSKVYDGTALTNSTCSLKSGSTLYSEHSLSCTTSGTITNVGTATNTVSTVKILYNGSTDVSSYYSITKESGTLTVTKATMTGGSVSISGTLTYASKLTATVTAPTKPSSGVTYSYQWYYNDEKSTTGGTAISGATSSTYTLLAVTLDKYVYCVVTIKDSNGNYSNKTVSKVTSGTVAKRPITVTSGSSSKVYNGTALTNSTCSLKSGSTILSGHELSCTTSGTITNAGSATNTISTAKIIATSTGGNVSTYYSITKEPGTLTVTQASCTCQISSYTSTMKYPTSTSGTINYSCGGDGTIYVTSGTTSVITAGAAGEESTALTAKGVGSSTITVGRKAGTNYKACSKTQSISVAASTYTISFNANGGTGAPSSQTKIYGQTLKLSTTKPKKDGYAFTGWAATSNATTHTWTAGGNYTDNGTKTLYAVWKKLSTYYVTDGTLNCMATASSSATVSNAYSCGTSISGYAYNTSWVYYPTGNCYMSSSYLNSVEPTCYYIKPAYGTFLNCRYGPNSNTYGVYTTYDCGTLVATYPNTMTNSTNWVAHPLVGEDIDTCYLWKAELSLTEPDCSSSSGGGGGGGGTTCTISGTCTCSGGNSTSCSSAKFDSANDCIDWCYEVAYAAPTYNTCACN